MLITASALGKPNYDTLTFPVALTRGQVEKSPDIDTDQPVSRQQETALHNHYGWPMYWIDPGTGTWPAVAPMAPIFAPQTSRDGHGGRADTHLRSIREVTGYHIHASDGELGHVEDFVVDDAFWVIRYMVVHARNWLPAKKVLISPQWLGEICSPGEEGECHDDTGKHPPLPRIRPAGIRQSRIRGATL